MFNLDFSNLFYTEHAIAGVVVRIHMCAKNKTMLLKILNKKMERYLELVDLDPSTFDIAINTSTGGKPVQIETRLNNGKVTIYLWDVYLVLSKTTLLHEMVHVKQLQHEDTVDRAATEGYVICMGARIDNEVLSDTGWRGRYWFLPSEREAYAVQLKEMNVVNRYLTKLFYLTVYGVWL